MLTRFFYLGRILIFQIIIFFLAENSLANKYQEKSAKPFGLTVESIRNTYGVEIIDNQPELGWMVPLEAEYQTAYEILLASSKQNLEKNIGDVWNSGKVESNRQNNIQINTVLQPNSTYFWKVRIYDKNKRLSAYSDVQSFTTGNFNTGKLSSSNVFVIEEIPPKSILENKDGSFFVDFGKAAFGTLEFNFKPTKKDTVKIRLGEKLKNGSIDRSPEGTIRYQEVTLYLTPEKEKYQVRLIADERNTNPVAVSLPDTFPVIMPFRYAEIEGLDAPLTPSALVQKAFFSSFDDNASSFSSNDTILNKVWDLCKYSIKATSFAGYYVDGDRERIPYEADAYLNQLSHYAVDNEYSIARKTIEYFMQKPTWPTEWQLHVALMVYQDYIYTGNTELIRRYYELLKHKTLMELEVEHRFISTSSPKHTGELMASLGFQDTTQRLSDIVDWPQKGGFGGVMGEDDGFVFRPINTVINSMYFGNMKIMAEFARLLQKTNEAEDFENRASKVKQSINQFLFDSKNGCYTDGIGTEHASVHANMFPLAFGVVPDERKKQVAAYIKTRGMACSVYGAQYLLEALYNAGSADYALKLMTATNDRSWYNMIKAGSTITMEAWDMKYKPNADWNHAWGAVPANIISREMWGIQPLRAGFETVIIQPQLSILKQSKIVQPTVRGPIECSYKRTNLSQVEYTINLPGNTNGVFVLPVSSYSEIVLNGKKLSLKSNNLQLHPGANHIKASIHPTKQ